MIFLAKSAQVLALFAFFVRVEARLFELVVRDGVLHSMDDELDALLHFSDLLGQGCLAQLYARARLVNEVNRFIRQEAVWNVTVRVCHGEGDGVIGIADGVELLVTIFDTEQNLGGINFGWRWNFHGLEAALE